MKTRATLLAAGLGLATLAGGIGAGPASAATPAVTAKFCAAQAGQSFYTQTKTTRTCTVYDGYEGTTNLISNQSPDEGDANHAYYFTGNYKRVEEFARTTVYTQNIKTGLITKTVDADFIRVVRFENVTCTRTNIEWGSNVTVTEVDIHECDVRGLYV